MNDITPSDHIYRNFYPSNPSSNPIDHPESYQEKKSDIPMNYDNEDLECLVKKRRMNDGSFQSAATTSSPKNSVGRDQTFSQGLENTFPTIQEESPTQTYTGSTPSRTKSPAIIGSANSLKRKLMTDLPDMTSSIYVNQQPSHENYGSIEKEFDAMYRRRFTESPRMASHAQARERDFIKPEGKLSKLQAKLKSKEGRHTVGKETGLFEIQEYQDARDYEQISSTKRRFDLSSPQRGGSPQTKKKVNLHPNKPGSQSVSKFSSTNNNLAFSWQNRNSETSQEQEFHFKARPMPRFVPFEAKKSDRKCVIPQDFVLHTEQRTMERKSHCLRDMSPDVNLGNSNDHGHNHHFKAKAMPTFNHVFKPRTGESALTETVAFNLNTKSRAERRTQFEMQMKEKERVNELKKRMQEEENKRKEQEELAEYRKKLVFKARPYRNQSPAIRDPNRLLISYQSPRKGTSMNTSVDQF